MKILKYLSLPFLFTASLHASVSVEKDKEVDIHTNKEEEEVKPTNPPKSEASLLERQFGSKHRIARKVLRKEWPTIKKEIVDKIAKDGKDSDDPYRRVFTRITMKELEKELDGLNTERLIGELKTAKLDCSAENFKKYLTESFTNHVNTKLDKEFEKWKNRVSGEFEKKGDGYTIGFGADPKSEKKYKGWIDFKYYNMSFEKEDRISKFIFEKSYKDDVVFDIIAKKVTLAGISIADFIPNTCVGFFNAAVYVVNLYKDKKEQDRIYYKINSRCDYLKKKFYKNELKPAKYIVGGLFAGSLVWLITSLTGMGIPTLIAHLAKVISPKMAAKLLVMLGLSGGSGYAAKRFAQWLGAGGGWPIIIGIIVALLIFLTTYFILQKQYPESFEEIRKGSVLMIYPLTILVLCATPAIASYYLFKYMYYEIGLPTWQCVSAPFVLLILLSIASKIAIKKFTAMQQKAMEEEVGEEVGVDSNIAVWWKGLWKEEEEKKNKGWTKKKKIGATLSAIVGALLAIWGRYKFFTKGRKAPKINSDMQYDLFGDEDEV